MFTRLEFGWETEVVYGEYFNSDIAEFKRSCEDMRVRAVTRCQQRVVACNEHRALAVFSPHGGPMLERVDISERSPLVRLDRLAMAPDGEFCATGWGHLLQYWKFQQDGRLQATGRVAGEAVGYQVKMLGLQFVDSERCLGISSQAVMLFERGVCVWIRPLESTLASLCGEMAVVAVPGKLALFRLDDWELLDEWPVGPLQALALSPEGRVAWLEESGLGLRQATTMRQAPRLPEPAVGQLHFWGERLFFSGADARVQHWQGEESAWCDWPASGTLLGASGGWLFEQTPAGFAGYGPAPQAPKTT